MTDSRSPLASGGKVWEPLKEELPKKQKLPYRFAALSIVILAMVSNLSIATLLILHAGPDISSQIDAQTIAVEKACPMISKNDSNLFVKNTAKFYTGPIIVTIKNKPVILDAKVSGNVLTLSNHDTHAKLCSVNSTLTKTAK